MSHSEIDALQRRVVWVIYHDNLDEWLKCVHTIEPHAESYFLIDCFARDMSPNQAALSWQRISVDCAGIAYRMRCFDAKA